MNNNDAPNTKNQSATTLAAGTQDSHTYLRKTYLSLGSNLGDRCGNLLLGVKELIKLDEGLQISRVYETKPAGGPAGQSNYYNAAVSLETSLHPRDILSYVNSIEHAAKRVRQERFGPRTLDVDILIMDGVLMSDGDLTIPHPRMHERAFVLAPLCDLVNVAELKIFTAIHPEFKTASWRDVLGLAEADNGIEVLPDVSIDPR